MNSYWKGNAETKDFSQWCKTTAENPNRIQIVSEPHPVSEGKYSYRIELQYRDNPSGSGCRATLASGPSGKLGKVNMIREGDEAFYGFSVFLPKDFVEIDKWRLVLQFKGYPDTGSPPISINIRKGEWLLNHRPTSTSNIRTKWRTPLRKGVWEKFMFHVNWSKDKSRGFIELYYNNKLAVRKFHTSTIHALNGVLTENHVAIGNYRDKRIKVTDVIYHDNFIAGKSYNEVKQ